MICASVSKTNVAAPRRSVVVHAQSKAGRDQPVAVKVQRALVAATAALMLSTHATPAEALVPKFTKGQEREEGFKAQNEKLQRAFAKQQAQV
jgi:hypothetical protein